MKIVLVSPYFGKHFGGGEKYLIDCARILAGNHQVNIAVSVGSQNLKLQNPCLAGSPRAEAGRQPNTKQISNSQLLNIKKEYESFFDVDLSRVEFIATPLFSPTNFLKKLLWTKQFDVIIYETDGSLFFSLAKKNILHIQTPLKLSKSSPVERLKLFNWQVKNTNSQFTKKVIEKAWQTKIDVVHYPMVNLRIKDLGLRKEKLILNVGRFFAHQHSKRQDVLVEIFADLIKKYPQETKGWQLVLIGSVEDHVYADKVAEMSKDLPIKIIHEAKRQQILDYYQQASFYWHATGFGVNELKHPEKVEHFGISTVEAMASGCVPVVLGKGGQVEVLGESLKDLLWQTKKECVEKTIEQIKNEKLRMQNAQLADKQAQKFGLAQFKQKLEKMIYA